MVIGFKKLSENSIALFILLGTFTGLSLGSWFTNSTYTFNEYSRICTAGHQDPIGFDNCMKQFWLNYSFYQNAEDLFLVLAVVVVAVLLFRVSKNLLPRRPN